MAREQRSDAGSPTDTAVSVQGASKWFRRCAHPAHRLRELFSRRPEPDPAFWALRDVSFEVKRGEAWGIVGRNGSGKSTLLQIVAGTLCPSAGRVQIQGRVAALLELGSGFTPSFTGRQNVFFNGQILGLSRREVEERFDRIAAFADIGDFLDQPVRSYSTGMVVRLAFAVAASMDPDILVVDEALAVGDAQFQARCMARMRQMREQGVTVLFVSHDLSSIKVLCDHALLLDHGRVLHAGTPKDTVDHYIALLGSEGSAGAPDAASRGLPLPTGKAERHGNRRVQVRAVRLLDAAQQEVSVLQTAAPFSVAVDLVATDSVPDLVVGISIRTMLGVVVYGTTTQLLGAPAYSLQPGEARTVVFRMTCSLGRGLYTLTVGLVSTQGVSYDWINDVTVVEVCNAVVCEGLADLRAALAVPDPA